MTARDEPAADEMKTFVPTQNADTSRQNLDSYNPNFCSCSRLTDGKQQLFVFQLTWEAGGRLGCARQQRPSFNRSSDG